MTDTPPLPLDVMLAAMRACLDEDDLEGAAAMARHAAPYVHPKPQAGGKDADVRLMTDEDLDEICGTGAGGAAVPGGNQG